MICSNMKKLSSNQNGFVSGAVITSIIFGLLTLVFGSIMIWALVNYNEQRSDVEKNIIIAQNEAKADQKEEDLKQFKEDEKEPLKEFIGPPDLGRVTFKYPKTWSVYVASDGSKASNYQAYLHPGEVPPTTAGANKFALQVGIVNMSYDRVLQQYTGLVKQGELRSKAIKASGFNGVRFDGSFSKELEGSLVVFKIRDKTLTIRTDSTAFKPDFDGKIVKTLSFDQ